MIKEFGVTNLEVTKEDIFKNPNSPIWTWLIMIFGLLKNKLN